MHVDRLLMQQATSEGFEEAREGASDKESGGAWGRKLRSIMWIAVHVQIPKNCAELGLPWQQRT